MASRPKLDQELLIINDKIVKMAELVQSTIIDSIKTIKEKDQEQARRIIDADQKIDDMEDDINEYCFKFLATQQPLAGDLRYCISIMKMVRDLERIGDHCEDLAKFALRMAQDEYHEDLIDIPRMADMAASMVSNAISAFLKRDLRLARKVWKSDEEVDELYRMIYEGQLALAEKDTKHTRTCINFAFIAAHLERIADYATNICEETVFSLEGDYQME